MIKPDAAHIAKHQPGPLDAAIELLREENEWEFFPLCGNATGGLSPGWADAAIRILEAAAKVDKKMAIYLREWVMDEPIRALLAALPDGGGND